MVSGLLKRLCSLAGAVGRLRNDPDKARATQKRGRATHPAHAAIAAFEALESRTLLSTWTGYDAGQDALAAWLAAHNLDSNFQPIKSNTGSGTTTKPKKPKASAAEAEPPQYSYRKKPANVPGIIQAENFDRGGPDVAYGETTEGNLIGAYRTNDWVDIGIANDEGGGYCVGRTAAREWMEYTINVPKVGFYEFSARVASLGAGGRFYVSVDGVKTSSILTVPNTGGWQKWRTLSGGGIILPQGVHVMRITMVSTGTKGNVANFNWFQLRELAPATAEGISAVAQSPFDVHLTWVDNSGNETGFKIERKTGVDGAWSQIASVAANVTSYDDAGLGPNTIYFYRVRSYNSTGDSPYSDEAMATTATAGQIVITHGGTYAGQWMSDDPDVPAVLIQTSEPVIIQNSVIRSRGDLIGTYGFNANVTIRNTRGYGLNPGVYGYQPGRFVEAEGFVNLSVENCYLEGTSGIYAYDYRGDGSVDQTISILRNSARNIDGRLSDGAGGWLADDGGYAQFFQMNGIHDLAGVEVAWNQVINDPDASLVEDNISIHDASGTALSPILIHDNYIKGAYPLDPANNTGHSGGGIMLSDNGSSWVRAYNNQVISTTNYGIAISSGHDNEFYNNRILSAGVLPDGSWVAAQNVGAYIWADGEAGFYNNSGRNNVIGWIDNGARNDWWAPDATAWTGNTRWGGTIGTATEAGEWTFWRNKLTGAGITVGAA